MDARPGGPTAKREPSPEGLGVNPEDDLPAPASRGSAVGAALNLSPLAPVSLGANSGFAYYAEKDRGMGYSCRSAFTGSFRAAEIAGPNIAKSDAICRRRNVTTYRAGLDASVKRP
jgi:hypothetical protein